MDVKEVSSLVKIWRESAAISVLDLYTLFAFARSFLAYKPQLLQLNFQGDMSENSDVDSEMLQM